MHVVVFWVQEPGYLEACLCSREIQIALRVCRTEMRNISTYAGTIDGRCLLILVLFDHLYILHILGYHGSTLATDNRTTHVLAFIVFWGLRHCRAKGPAPSKSKSAGSSCCLTRVLRTFGLVRTWVPRKSNGLSSGSHIVNYAMWPCGVSTIFRQKPFAKNESAARKAASPCWGSNQPAASSQCPGQRIDPCSRWSRHPPSVPRGKLPTTWVTLISHRTPHFKHKMGVP